jgi:signal transduction histidine kinase
MSLRTRVLLAFAPLVALLAAVGAAGLAHLHKTGERIDAILRENYASVQAMYRLNEALERADSAFQVALSAGDPERERAAREQFESNWAAFEAEFRAEENNVTIHPAEDNLVAQLRARKDDYRARGRDFFAPNRARAARHAAYYGAPGAPGLEEQFRAIKGTSGAILKLNQEQMERTRGDARATSRQSFIGFGAALSATVALVFGIAWYVRHTVLAPIRAVTQAAEGIGESGHLDREVPVYGAAELGRLAHAFNAMTRQLRAYRRTDLDRLIRAQRTAQATIDSFPDPVLVLDPLGRVELTNPAARALLGVTASDTGPAWQPPDALRAPVAEALRAQRAYQPDGFDQTVTYRLAEERTYLPQVRPIRGPDGDTLGAAIVLTDVTRFRTLDQIKTDLIATVSHELKTPLTSVRLALHVLLEETVGPLTPKQTELLVDARDGAERLLAMIEQLLALARLQRQQGRESFRPHAPAEVLARAADAARARAEDKNIALEVTAAEPLPAVDVDPERFGRALDNLLANAVTYTPPGGTVSLRAERTAAGVAFTVADTGVGIPSEYLPHVFDQFFRIPGQSDEAGTGLGLAIVKEAVTAHGGEVTCTSAPGAGTVFRIVLPAPGSNDGARGE